MQRWEAVVEEVTPGPQKTVKSSCVTWASSVACELVLCGSGLSSQAHELLTSLVNKTGARLSETWDPRVMHLIMGTDGTGAAKRTLKFMLATLAGNWILKTQWVEACMAACHPVREEAFEVRRDIYGLVGGPKRARLLAASRKNKLLEGVECYFLGDFVPAYKTDLQTLVSAAGGRIVTVLEDGWSLEQETPMRRARVVVYNSGMMPRTDDPEVIRNRWLQAKSVAYKVKAYVVAHTWLLDSMAAYELQPVH